MTRRRLLIVLLIGTALAYLWVGSRFVTWSPEDARSQATPESPISESAASAKSTQEKEEELEAAQRALWEAGADTDKLIGAYARVAQAEEALHGPNWREMSIPPTPTTIVGATPQPSETVEDAPPPPEETVDDAPPLPQNEADEPVGQ